MGDHTKPAVGASEDPGIPPNVCRNGWHVPIPADNAEHLECAVDPNEMLIASLSTSECDASEPSEDDSVEDLECVVDSDEIHVEAATTIPAKHMIFTCNECAWSFISKKLYVRHHKIVHNRDIPRALWCLYCDYCTTDKSNYNRHTLAHVEEKRHTCDECQKTFRRLEHLVMHKVTHTNEKKFQCPTCSQSFNRRSNLARHEMSKHRGDKTRLNACELCGRCFVRADNLARHQLVHTRERRFICEKCPKRFGHLSALKRHVMKFHALEPSP